MLRSLKQVSALLLVTALAACGGGGSAEPPAQFGSIATQTPTSGVMGLSTGKQTQSLANADAIEKCKAAAVITVSCAVRQEFVGVGQCGALSRGANSIIGWGIGASITQAEANAVAACRNNGGTSCASIQSQCN
jgi:hypothetical protein